MIDPILLAKLKEALQEFEDSDLLVPLDFEVLVKIAWLAKELVTASAPESK